MRKSRRAMRGLGRFVWFGVSQGRSLEAVALSVVVEKYSADVTAAVAAAVTAVVAAVTMC